MDRDTLFLVDRTFEKSDDLKNTLKDGAFDLRGGAVSALEENAAVEDPRPGTIGPYTAIHEERQDA